MERQPPRTGNFVTSRGAWWVIGAAAGLLLILRGIQWSRGRHSLPDLLIPCGLLALSASNLLDHPTTRRLSMGLGILLVIVALILRYRS